MKKNVMVWLLGLALAVSVTGCGGDKAENPDKTAGTEQIDAAEQPGDTESAGAAVVSGSGAFDLKGADYVTVCDYSAIEVTISGDYEVTDADVTEYLAQLLTDYGPFYTDDPEKTVIEAGDIVDVDYVGKKDGVAFDRGSAEHQLLDVSNNSSVDGSRFIDGFTDGLLGASVGDVIDCDVTFPENYGNADLAGQPVVFTFTVNAVQKQMTVDDVDDAFAQEQFQVENVAEMNAQLRDYLENVARYNREQDTYQAVQDYLVGNSTVEIPEDYLAARISDYRRHFIDQSCGGDESQLEDFLSVYYGQSVEEMEAYWAEMTERSVRLELVMDVIAEELGITEIDDAYQDYADQMAARNNYASAEEMYPAYGYGDAVYGEKHFKALYRYDQALDQVIASAVVHVNTDGQAPDDVQAETDGTEAVSDGMEPLDDGTMTPEE